jgi:hypothetical protein
VLFQKDNQASLLIYLAGASNPAVFGTRAVTLAKDPESARRISVARWDYVVRHNPGLNTTAAPRAFIEDGVGMGSLIYCYLNGSWAVLPGAD